MIITRFEEYGQSKVKVYLDDEYAFWLTDKELRLYRLEVGKEISPSAYHEINNEIVYKRAQQKALSLLKFMDRTEQELRKKLSEAGFTQDIIDKTISYIFSYGYLNDERLACSYIRAKKGLKSKLVIRMELAQKGVSNEIINQAIAEEYEEEDTEDPELTAIRKAIAKKTKNPDTLEYEVKQKLIASLYRKGFEIGKIKQIIG